MATWDTAASAYRTNIDGRQPTGRRMVSRCLSTADMKIRNAAGQRHNIVAFYAHGVVLTDKETGEVTPRIRLVMVRDDGKTISTFSEPCINAFSAIVRHLDNGPIDPPLCIEIREWPLGEGRSYCDLREVEPEPVAKPKKS